MFAQTPLDGISHFIQVTGMEFSEASFREWHAFRKGEGWKGGGHFGETPDSAGERVYHYHVQVARRPSPPNPWRPRSRACSKAWLPKGVSLRSTWPISSTTQIWRGWWNRTTRCSKR